MKDWTFSMDLKFKDLKIVDFYQFPVEVRGYIHHYVNANFSLSNNIYICFNNEVYGDDFSHDEIVDYLQGECGFMDERVLISRWW